MSKYSIDDILAEFDEKKQPVAKDKDVDDILKDILGEPQPKQRRLSPAEQRKLDRQREEEEKARKAAEEKARKAAEEIERKRRASAEAERRKAAAAAEEERLKREIAAEKKRQEELAAKKAAEEAEEKRRLKQENEERRAAEAARLAELSAEERRAEAERLRKEEESELLYATKNIVIEDAPIELPKIAETAEIDTDDGDSTAEIELEKSLRQQKIESDAQKLLIKDSEFEDPDDFLRSMNPYDFSRSTGFTQMIETIPAEQLSGDTIGVAGNELKELARASAKDDDRSITQIVGGATTVMPDLDAPAAGRPAAFDPEKTMVLPEGAVGWAPDLPDTKEIDDIPPKKPKKEKKPKTPEEEKLLESINRTLEQNRLEEKAESEPVSVSTVPIGTANIPTVTGAVPPLGTTMPRTGQIPVSDPAIAEQKAKEIAAKRKRRITNFVLEDITDEDIDLDSDEEEDFEAREDDGQIWVDLSETHKGLRIRFILLLIVTLFLGTVTVLQEFGVSMQTTIFGSAVDFLDKRYDTQGFVFMNLICGVVGMGLCSSVITNGIAKLFKRRADCDSLCSVSCILSLAAGVLHLTNTDYLQRSRAYLYIAAALVGLMFNTLGKLSMIVRAKKNFRVVAAEGEKYYADIVDSQSEASAFTKGVVSELPYLATMRKAELLTDFLRKSYCEDKADRTARRLVPLSLIIGLVMGLLAYFVPNGTEGMENNIFWATSVFIGTVCVMSPFSAMFMVNNPMRRATKALAKSGCTLLGYASAEEFGATNAVLTDAASLFPKSAVECTNLKPCKLQNSINNISLDQSIILAASLAIKSGSLLSGLFYDMIGGNKELLVDIDGCVYEDNMGVMGWYGTKRLIMGNREHMKHHSIKVPEMSAIAKYGRNGSDSVYLAVGGELVIIFFIRLTANPKVRAGLRELQKNNVSLVVKTTDSIVTIGKIADLFDVDPEKTRIIGSNLHDLYRSCTHYTSDGSASMTCNGSFVSIARGINAAKKILKDVSASHAVTVAGIFFGLVLMFFLMFSVKTFAFSPAVIICWNLLWMLIMLLVQSFRKY